jgi:hypothetical protein
MRSAGAEGGAVTDEKAKELQTAARELVEASRDVWAALASNDKAQLTGEKVGRLITAELAMRNLLPETDAERQGREAWDGLADLIAPKKEGT